MFLDMRYFVSYICNWIIFIFREELVINRFGWIFLNLIFFGIILDIIVIIVIYIIIKDFFNFFVEYVVVIDISWIIMIEDMLKYIFKKFKWFE